MKRAGARGRELPLERSCAPCSPCRDGEFVAASASPPRATIQLMTASKSAPSAKIAARSIVAPPPGRGRASRV